MAGGVVAALSVNVIALKSEGEPVNGARVVLGGEFRVDANGIASFPEIDPGSYTVSAVAPGLGRVTKDVAVEDGKASQVEVRLADASLSGRLREIAAEPSPPFRAKLIVSPTIGPAVRDAIHRDGTFEVEHLPVGSATLSVDADVQSNTKRNFPRYDLDDEEVNLMPGQSEITLDAPISAVETFVRWELLLESGRRPNLIRAGRKYHHPDSLRYGCPPREFASDVQRNDDAGTSANDFQVLGQRSLRRWVSHVGDKRFRYRNAAELTVATNTRRFPR